MTSAPLRLLLALGFVATLFVVGGSVGGWLWERRWVPPRGVAYSHQFILTGQGPARDFSGTGSYLLIALVIGLLLGLTVALVVRGQEVAALVAVVAFSALAAWLMATVGHRLGPPDPTVVAATAADFTKLRQQLVVNGFSPYLALPFGALLGLVGGYLLLFLFPGLRRRATPVVATLFPDTTR
ncbi:MAG: hypothetical protein U0R80_12085 [Nocardioidaceae bacterium]